MSTAKVGLTIEEAAECTGIGRNTMRKLVDWGKLPVLKVGRKTIIRRDTLEHFMTVNQGRNLRSEKDVRKVEEPFSKSPRRFRAKYAPRTNLTICTPGISPLQGACITASAHALCYDTEKIAPQFSVAVPLSKAIGTAATDLSVAK